MQNLKIQFQRSPSDTKSTKDTTAQCLVVFTASLSPNRGKTSLSSATSASFRSPNPSRSSASIAKESHKALHTQGLDPQISSFLLAAKEEGSLRGSFKEICIFRNVEISDGHHLVSVGLGYAEKASLETLRQATTAVLHFLKSHHFQKACIQIDSACHVLKREADTDIASAMTEGLMLGHYSFDTYKNHNTHQDSMENPSNKKQFPASKSSAVSKNSAASKGSSPSKSSKAPQGSRSKPGSTDPKGPMSWTLISQTNETATALKKSIENAKIISEAVNIARALGDTPGNLMTPEILAKRVQEEARNTEKLKVTMWDKARIKKERMGGLYGVSLGSDVEPRFITMEYKGASPSKKPVCFVGKGLTFDSGGISLKPPPKMDEMKYDMCGGANVIGAMLAISRLQLKVNAVAYIPASENMPGPMANKPGDILTARNGKTVEVFNTDAEGRLILMDALSYASEKKPAVIVDAATLTGAIIVSLGNSYTGVFTRNSALLEKIKKAAEKTGENIWPMPICDNYVKDIRGIHADLANISSTTGAGSGTAAAFLEQFVDEDIPWAHFDIAGTAWNMNNRCNYHPKKGATGCLVRTFVEFAKMF